MPTKEKTNSVNLGSCSRLGFNVPDDRLLSGAITALRVITRKQEYVFFVKPAILLYCSRSPKVISVFELGMSGFVLTLENQ